MAILAKFRAIILAMFCFIENCSLHVQCLYDNFLKIYKNTNPTICLLLSLCFFFFNDTATTEIYTLSLHDALPIWITSFQFLRDRVTYAPHDCQNVIGKCKSLWRDGNGQTRYVIVEIGRAHV